MLPLSHVLRLRLRLGFVVAVIAALLGGRLASAVPPLPIALLASFDEAIAVVTEAAERRIAALEQQPAAPRRAPCVAELLSRVEGDVMAACDDARAALDRAIQIELAPGQRATVLASIDRELVAARRDGDRTSDPVVRLEYDATCAQLQAIRALI